VYFDIFGNSGEMLGGKSICSVFFIIIIRSTNSSPTLLEAAGWFHRSFH
jgi:hypothetical protein